MPPIAATGTNTAISDSEVAIIGPETSFMAARVASRGFIPCSIFAVTASTTTIASSTTMPMARTRPSSDKRVDRKAEQREHREGADQRYRHGQGGDQSSADILQKNEHHQNHQRHRLEQRDDDLADAGLNRERGIQRYRVVEAFGKVWPTYSSMAALTASATSSPLAPGNW